MATAPVTGQVSVTATRAQLSSTAYEAGLLYVQAHPENSEEVYYGDSTVTTSTGRTLQPGETYVVTYVNKPGEVVIEPRTDKIYVLGTTGDKVTWEIWRR